MIAEFNIRTRNHQAGHPRRANRGLVLARIDPKYLDACLKVIADAGKLDLFEWVIYHGYTKNPDDATRTSRR